MRISIAILLTVATLAWVVAVLLPRLAVASDPMAQRRVPSQKSGKPAAARPLREPLPERVNAEWPTPSTTRGAVHASGEKVAHEMCFCFVKAPVDEVRRRFERGERALVDGDHRRAGAEYAYVVEAAKWFPYDNRMITQLSLLADARLKALPVLFGDGAGPKTR